MSPLVTSLMLLMVLVINTKAAPNPGTDTDEYSYESEEPFVPCEPNCPPSGHKDMTMLRGKRGFEGLDLDGNMGGFSGKLTT